MYKLILLHSQYFLLDADSNNSKVGETNYDQSIRVIMIKDDLAHSDSFKVLAKTSKTMCKHLPNLDLRQIKRLLHKYKGGVDVDRVAESIVDRESAVSCHSPLRTQYEKYVRLGYNQCLKDNNDNMFTMDEMIDFACYAYSNFGSRNMPSRVNSFRQSAEIDADEQLKKISKQYEQTEWGVEIKTNNKNEPIIDKQRYIDILKIK